MKYIILGAAIAWAMYISRQVHVLMNKNLMAC